VVTVADAEFDRLLDCVPVPVRDRAWLAERDVEDDRIGDAFGAAAEGDGEALSAGKLLAL
jgi:hypothetical protein